MNYNTRQRVYALAQPRPTECLTCEFEDVGGHVILDLGGTKALLDTGSPITLGRQSDWEFLGTRRQLATRFEAITMEALSDAVRTPIDVLLGTDLLSECPFEIDWPSGRVTFAGPSNGAGLAVPLATRLGHPVATAKFGGETLRFVVDTGAVKSFLPPKRLKAGRASGCTATSMSIRRSGGSPRHCIGRRYRWLGIRSISSGASCRTPWHHSSSSPTVSSGRNCFGRIWFDSTSTLGQSGSVTVETT